MKLKWEDSLAIAITLDDVHPNVDPKTVDLKDLHRWVGALKEFDDDPKQVDQEALMAIQRAWVEERE